MAGQHEIGENNFRARFLVDSMGKAQNGLGGLEGFGLRAFAGIGQGAGVLTAFFRGKQHHRLGGERVQFTRVIHNFSVVIVEIAEPEFQRRALHFADVLKEFAQGIKAATAEDGQTREFRRGRGRRDFGGVRLFAPR